MRWIVELSFACVLKNCERWPNIGLQFFHRTFLALLLTRS